MRDVRARHCPGPRRLAAVFRLRLAAAFVAPLAAALVPIGDAAGQVPDTAGQPSAVVVDTSGTAEWNGPRARALIAAARERRHAPLADSTLQNYRARAEGFVYFYVDRRDSDERTLVKIDQVALDVFWAQPDQTKQRIVGMRDVSRLPNRMYYHIDHLSVVQNGFSDTIRMGDGDEVRDVVHPAARGSEAVYDFRLVDSLTLVLPGAPEPVRVYEVQVRPRFPDRSGFVGSVFIDRTRGDIVRMTFTFTPASYVDRRLDYINISLDSGLWDGRYWLPYEQAVELRRQVPELDFIGGAVIRGRMRIGGYDFNTDLPDGTFRGPPVSIVSRAELEDFEFERELYADLGDEGLAPPPEMAELRREAARLLRREKLSGLPPLRLNVPSASSVLRYNRLEGVFAGGGLAYVPGERLRLDITGGYAFGAEEPAGRAGVTFAPTADWSLTAAGYRHALRDVGTRPGLPTVLSSATAFFGANDYTDPFFASGGSLRIERRLGADWTISVSGRHERHDGARRTAGEPIAPSGVSGDDRFARRLIAIDRGTLSAGTLELHRAPSDIGTLAWGADFALEPGTLEGLDYVRALASGTLAYRAMDRTVDARLRMTVGATSGGPAQRHFLLGGRETLPGYAYRAYSGSRMALADVEVARDIVSPWLRVRALATAGWSSGSTIGRLVANPDVIDPVPGEPFPIDVLPDTDGPLASVGIGLASMWDQLRLDIVRGLNGGGEWQLLFSIAPDFWSML